MKEVTEKRIKNIRNKMRKENMDAILISRRENYMYLSGFTGTSAWLIITEKDAVLVTDFRYTEQASKQAPGYAISTYRGSVIKGLNDVLEDKKVEVLGFEDNVITYDTYTEYKDKLNIKQLVPIKGMMEEARIIKDAREIELITKAVKIADDTFEHILGFIKPGVTEVEVASEMEYYMRKQGASGASFDTIIASGLRSSMPHGVASEKKIEQGDAITLDFGAIYSGYCSDMTRTVFLGKPDKELEKIYKIVLEAQLQSSAGVKKGANGKDIDAIARDYISKNGFGDHFGHGLGHGVGLEIHEEPRLSMSASKQMKNGMVVTVEPGIYVDGLGGVRIEDILIVDNDKPLVLTSSTKEMIVI